MRLGFYSAAIAATVTAGMALAHGDVAPQPVNTDALPDVSEEWLIENPYRDQGEEVWQAAIEIGDSGYNQNCARCHGLGVVSGGLAPDLRYLEAEEYGDEWYIERFREGYTQNGITKMPAFGDLLGQKAAWAIRTYIETRPDDGALDDHSDRLKEIRDELAAMAEGADGDTAALQSELNEIAGTIETGSGAPVADSVALRAAVLISGEAPDFAQAAEQLTIGLSAAQ
ncbi:MULTISPECIES: cytochrome c-550 PedF [unclassified Ruegeria]|uniref:cytochrome c-550 PedF n=1 Tax=unclassified Ruegeria TaxID=2625375 RepID=UPI0012684F72|nr:MULTISPECIES: cytochrome c-550 PedF [unclassified Ruegeria]QFT75609.1 Quinohemoprotein alcohol dehydrogenase ADH-IIG precursor [Ruegeria sp. THAF33]UAB90979.1 cytochrome c-550 PedF [Ruegeria sp. SCSIO 43209]